MSTLVLRADKKHVTPNQWIIRAHIASGDYTISELDRRVLLSPACTTAAELNTWADRLIKELQDIKRKASLLPWDGRPGRSSPSN